MPDGKQKPSQFAQRGRYAGFLTEALSAANIESGVLQYRKAEMAVWQFRDRSAPERKEWFDTGIRLKVTNFSLTQDLAVDTFVRVVEWDGFYMLETWECEPCDFSDVQTDDDDRRFFIIELYPES